jgi:amidase
MAWVAHGSDMGGSLRNPASFNSVCGLRPSPGRVACSRTAKVDGNLGQEGPMARNVEDLALLLDAMCGAETGDPVSKPRPVPGFLDAVRAGWKPARIAFSRELGITPVDSEVAAIVEGAVKRFAEAGVIVEEAHPDLAEAHECFQTLRALSFATGMKPLLEAHRDKLKPEVVWNIEKGLALTAAEIIRAENQRAAMFARTVDFFRTCDLLITPTTIVPPFPVENRYVESCGGHRFETYIDWLAIVYAITNVCCPALSVPAGFTSAGLPVGMQIVGPPSGDARVLAAGRLFETISDLDVLLPIDPRG